MLTATLTFSVHVVCFLSFGIARGLFSFVFWHCQRPFFFCPYVVIEAQNVVIKTIFFEKPLFCIFPLRSDPNPAANNSDAQLRIAVQTYL